MCLFVCFYCPQKKIQMTVIYSGQKKDVWQHFFCKVTTISHFKSGKLHMHLSLKYMHDSNNYILLSSTKIHAHTVYFLSKSYSKILCRKINCSSSFLVILQQLQWLRFTKWNDDYKKETKTKAAFACAIWNDIPN